MWASWIIKKTIAPSLIWTHPFSSHWEQRSTRISQFRVPGGARPGCPQVRRATGGRKNRQLLKTHETGRGLAGPEGGAGPAPPPPPGPPCATPYPACFRLTGRGARLRPPALTSPLRRPPESAPAGRAASPPYHPLPPPQPQATGWTRPRSLAAQAQVGDGAHARILNSYLQLLSDTRTRTDQSWRGSPPSPGGVLNKLVLKELRPKCKGGVAGARAPPSFLPVSWLSPAWV